MSTARRLIVVLVTTLAALTAAMAIPGTASADPVIERRYCGAWDYSDSVVRGQACVTFVGTTSVHYSVTLHNYSTVSKNITSAYVDSKIGTGSWTNCYSRGSFTLAKGQYASYYCSSTQIAGKTYRARGGFSYGSGGQTFGYLYYSPTKTA